MIDQDNIHKNISEYFKIIQDVIKRMGQNSFLIKAWCITIFAGIFSFTYSFINIIIVGVILFIIIIFWVLDSYYLYLETLFRDYYNKKVEEYNDDEKREHLKLFKIDLKAIKKQENNFIEYIFSISEILFYVPLLIINIVLIIILILI